MLEKLKNISIETKILLLVLFISGIVHGYNMFHFPYYENDEGVYMSQAWSILKEGKLSPYTYWYDHAPGGWILIALWVLLTGGFFSFGFSINSGRVLMLVLHLFSVFFLFKITRRITKSNLAAVLTVLFFSLSPLGLYYQRRVLLDNIMVFWTLCSIYFLFLKSQLRYIILSALTFGIAILSKENAIFFIPAILFILFFRTHSSHKVFAFGLWIIIVSSIVSTYILLSILKGELFPTGTILGGFSPHVSLITSLHAQVGRGSNAPLSDFKNNLFWIRFREWIDNDAGIILTGIAATALSLLIGIKNKYAFFAGLLSVMFLIFLIRGGVVLEFYVVPLLPFLALNIAIVVESFAKIFKKYVSLSWYYSFYAVIFLVALIWYGQKHGVIFHENLFTSDQTTPQIQAVSWLKTQTDPGSFVVIDNYGYIEMHDNSLQQGNYSYAEWYWKVDEDPQIKKIIHNDPSNIAYIGETHQMQSDVQNSGLILVGDALAHASVIKQFYKDNWGITIWATHFPQQILSLSWNSYKIHFITKDGATVDPYRDNATTSEGQSYTLLRSVWMNDKKQFNTTWQWTKTNMQKSNGLFAWYVKSDNIENTKKINSASDADEDIALALLFGYAKWHNYNYLYDAKKVINGIWIDDVKFIKNKPYLAAGDWESSNSDIIFNPSYFAPYEYKIFAEVDIHAWEDLVKDSYAVLQECSSANLDTPNSVGLPPNWCALSSNGTIATAPKNVGDSNYSYDAFRVPWRITLDYLWYKDPRAKEYLDSQTFVAKQWKDIGKILVGYTHDGNVNQNYESAGAYGANIGSFIISDPKAANTIYQEKILPKFYTNENDSYWEDPKNYYVQNWAWFGTAMYFGKLDNLWEDSKTQFKDVLNLNL